jgi:hypothetical protein
MARTCGTAGYHCRHGEKPVSLYLSVRLNSDVLRQVLRDVHFRIKGNGVTAGFYSKMPKGCSRKEADNVSRSPAGHSASTCRPS